MSRIIPKGFGQPNFKPSIKDRLRKEKPAAEKRPGMSPSHLQLIRLMPCAIPSCGKYAPSDPHHLKAGVQNERGMGRRATDRWAVPLCRSCHDSVESVGSKREPAWIAARGIDDALQLANGLWMNTGNLAAMIKVLLANRKSEA